jgi:hypothetical protein
METPLPPVPASRPLAQALPSQARVGLVLGILLGTRRSLLKVQPRQDQLGLNFTHRILPSTVTSRISSGGWPRIIVQSNPAAL